MPRLPDDQLSKTEKGYRVSVGYHRGADGKTRPRVFWLGHDFAVAHYAADTYRGKWHNIDLAGRRHWTPEDEAEVKDYVRSFVELRDRLHRNHDLAKQRLEHDERMLGVLFGPVVAAPTAEPTADVSAPARTQTECPTLYKAVEAFLESLKGKRRSDSHKERADRVLNVNLKHARQNCSLSEIDYLWIDRLCDHFKARPPSLKDGKPLKPYTVAAILRYLRLFFVWLDDTNHGGWEGPRKLLKPFRVRIEDLMTPAELREGQHIKQFDLDTLAKLYGAASDFQKALMLAALFTGATQQELAVLEQDEFDLDAATLTHHRNKTRVLGRYWLPPELVALLHADFVKRPGDPLAFRTGDGNSLVTFKDGRQVSDAVRQTWDDLREAAGLPDALSFKYLRKYLADWMTRNGGEAMGQVALSHSRQTVLAKNYTSSRDFDAFNDLQRRMYDEMNAAGLFRRVTGHSAPKRRNKSAPQRSGPKKSGAARVPGDQTCPVARD